MSGFDTAESLVGREVTLNFKRGTEALVLVLCKVQSTSCQDRYTLCARYCTLSKTKPGLVIQ